MVHVTKFSGDRPSDVANHVFKIRQTSATRRNDFAYKLRKNGQKDKKNSPKWASPDIDDVLHIK